MSAAAVIYARLSATTAVTALVSTRIYPDVLPDSPVYPAITYHQISGSSERGAIVDPVMLMSMMQITCWAKSRNQARAIADQVRKAMDRLRLVTLGNTVLNDCFFENDVDLYDPPTKTYYVALDFRMHIKDNV